MSNERNPYSLNLIESEQSNNIWLENFRKYASNSMQNIDLNPGELEAIKNFIVERSMVLEHEGSESLYNQITNELDELLTIIRKLQP